MPASGTWAIKVAKAKEYDHTEDAKPRDQCDEFAF